MSAPRSLTWIDGAWHEGNPPLIGPMSQAFWLGSSVFDGARAFEGVTPDLDQHCARVNRSALALGLTILLLFPFTRLVHMLSAPVRYIWRPGYQIVRSRKLAA